MPAPKAVEIKGGGAAVKAHADEMGLTDGIKKIIDAFGGNDQVKDIEITSPGRKSYLRSNYPESVRVRPGGEGTGVTTKELINEQKSQRPSWKK